MFPLASLPPALASLWLCLQPPQEAVQATDAPPPELRASHEWMLSRLQEIEATTADSNPWLGDARVHDLRRRLADLRERARPARRVRLLQQLAEEELRIGEVESAIERLQEALRQMAPESAGIDEGTERDVQHLLGVCYLRWAEDLNCVCASGGQSCIVPFVPEALHSDRRGSEAAVRCFERVLELDPQHIEARWLLQIALMTLGAGDATLEGHELDPALFERGGAVPAFPNVAADLGIDTLNLSGGVVVEDFDGDGDLDVLTSTFDTRGGMRYLRNEGGRFVDATEGSGLEGLRGGLNMVQGDADGDGRIDVVVLRGAWLGPAGRHPNSLLKNLGEGRFIDIARWAGLAEVDYPTQTAAWADYDGDGDLDLYVGNEDMPGRGYPNQLFQNQGDGRFRDVAGERGVLDHGYTKGVVWGDHDGDGDPDLYVSNLGGPNRLYRNDGPERGFVDVAERAGVLGPIRSFPVWFWDFDNDGALDLFVPSYLPGVSTVAASYFGEDVGGAEISGLYRGDGRGGFTNVAAERGLTRRHAPMGCNFGDFDYDGFPDFYFGTGSPDYAALMPNVLYHNEGGRRFVDVTAHSRTGHLQKGHGVAFADLDMDGDQDLFAQLGGAYPGDAFHDALFQNPGFGHHRLEVELRGVDSNRHGIGARLRVRIEEGGVPREVYAEVSSGGSFGANSLRAEIGLGRATKVGSLAVRWPGSDRWQSFEELPADVRVHVVEGADELEIIPLVRPSPR